jgi:pentatricopeptide repeat protein
MYFREEAERTAAGCVHIHLSLSFACAKGIQSDKALEVYTEMKQSGLQPEVFTYNSLSCACAKSIQSEKALEVYTELK